MNDWTEGSRKKAEALVAAVNRATAARRPAAVARAYQDAQHAQDRQLPTWNQLSPRAKALRVREAGHWIAAVHAAERNAPR